MTSQTGKHALNKYDDSNPIASSKALSNSALGKWGAISAALVMALLIVVWLGLSTRETRAGVSAYTRLTAAVNMQDFETVRKLCSARFLQTHPLKTAPEGGLVGFPRYIHKNFQAWREGPAVWVCPTNRVGPIYQFLREDGEWKFDGLVGLLRSGHQIMVLPEESRNGGDESLIAP